MNLDWCIAEIKVLKREVVSLRALVVGDGLADKVFDLTKELVKLQEDNARLRRGEFTKEELQALKLEVVSALKGQLLCDTSVGS